MTTKTADIDWSIGLLLHGLQFSTLNNINELTCNIIAKWLNDIDIMMDQGNEPSQVFTCSLQSFISYALLHLVG